jgi:hypothetical protein
MRTGRGSPGIAADGQYIYVYGGMENFNGGTSLNTVERYDPAANTWEEVGDPMAAATVGPAFAYTMGRVWAIGGIGDGGSLLTVNQYLPVGGNHCVPSSVVLSRITASTSPSQPTLLHWPLPALLALLAGLTVLIFTTKAQRH